MSQTYIGIIVGLLSSVLPKFGVQVGSEELTQTISLIGTIVGTVWALWGRYRAGGITALGFRKA